MSQRINRFQRIVFASFLAVFLTIGSFGVFAAPVNINMANAEILSTELSGIGATKAAAIIAYRESHGPFKSLNDLLNVKGIGVKILEKNRANLIIEVDKNSP